QGRAHKRQTNRKPHHHYSFAGLISPLAVTVGRATWLISRETSSEVSALSAPRNPARCSRENPSESPWTTASASGASTAIRHVPLPSRRESSNSSAGALSGFRGAGFDSTDPGVPFR